MVLFAELRRGAAAMNEALHAWLALVCLLVGIEIAYLGSYLGWRTALCLRVPRSQQTQLR